MLTVPDVDNLIEWLREVRSEMVAGDVAADKIIQLHQRRTAP
jgi:L-ribulose-5-phosphate 3-epimerase UlaE